jgi:predicted dehydrogenase
MHPLHETPGRDSDPKQGARIALVGCGEVCEHKHLPALTRVKGARLVALVDPDSERARRLAARYVVPHVFSRVSDLMDSGVANVVGVLVPPAAHAEVALSALAGGACVLVEKPIGLDLDTVDGLVSSAPSARAVMGFHMRWHRLVRAARLLLDQGAVGTVESIHAVWNSPRPDRLAPPWKRSRSMGGGAIVELGVHIFDLWRFLLGAEVQDVFARCRHGLREDESATVNATMTNGVLASASLSERSSHEIEIEINGDRGRLRVSCQRFDGLELFATRETSGMVGPRIRGLGRALREFPRGLSRMRTLGDYGESYKEQWEHVLDVAAGRCAPASTLSDGREALRVVLAAAASATRGAPVRVAEAPRTIERALRV